eukprot:3253065-Heterocapsa_arctica.AAC.1
MRLRIEVEGGGWRPGGPERRDTRSSGRKVASHGRFSDRATRRRSLPEEGCAGCATHPGSPPVCSPSAAATLSAACATASTAGRSP